MALRKLNVMIERRPTNYVLDADIKGFFDHVDHEWAVKFIENFRYRTGKSLFYWPNRRSQKESYSWNAFNDMLKAYPLVRPKIYVSIYG